MVGRDWSEVVEEAVRRHVDSTGDRVFTRQALSDAELDRIVSETGSEGATPHQTLSRELQQLRDVSADWVIRAASVGPRGLRACRHMSQASSQPTAYAASIGSNVITHPPRKAPMAISEVSGTRGSRASLRNAGDRAIKWKTAA